MVEEKETSYAGATRGRFNKHRQRFKEVSTNENSSFKGGTEDLKEHTFFYGKKWQINA
jgi:hypothetical protein